MEFIYPFIAIVLFSLFFPGLNLWLPLIVRDVLTTKQAHRRLSENLKVNETYTHKQLRKEKFKIYEERLKAVGMHHEDNEKLKQHLESGRIVTYYPFDRPDELVFLPFGAFFLAILQILDHKKLKAKERTYKVKKDLTLEDLEAEYKRIKRMYEEAKN